MEDKQQPTASQGLISIEQEVFELRFLFLCETSPQSNRYAQLLLTHEQYLEINKIIKSFMPLCTKHNHPEGKTCVEFMFEDKYDIPIDEKIRAYYPPEYIRPTRKSGE